MAYAVARFVADCLFPRACPGCDRTLPPGAASWLCGPCRAGIVPLAQPACMRCSVPLPAPASLCHRCHLSPPAFSSCCAVGLYLPSVDGLNPLAAAIRQLKYGRRRALAGTLGALLSERYPYAPAAVLVPVPLHRTRLRSRGFNQAALLAAVVARRRGLAIAARALVRVRATDGQPGLRAAARQRNLRDAFAVRRPETFRAHDVVLVDDVLTTGATADACAHALLAAGARRVDVLVVGRTP